MVSRNTSLDSQYLGHERSGAHEAGKTVEPMTNLDQFVQKVWGGHPAFRELIERLYAVSEK